MIKNGGIIEEVITDNGKEFCNREFEELCRKYKVKHTKVGMESHRSNGRVERVIGTIRKALMKDTEGTLTERTARIADAYNNTYQTAIGCTPMEACADTTGKITRANSPEGKYAGKFKVRPREKFEVGERVRIAKSDNLGGKSKEYKGRFLIKGEILDKCGGDSYLVRKEDGKIVKKRHYDLKMIC